MKIFVNVARLEIGQLFTQGMRWGHPCTMDTFLLFWQIILQIKALQALHDTLPLCLFLLLHMFWHKNINVTTRFDQIHQLFHKILSINIILKSIKGHNSVEKFGKIMCISHKMDHIYQCINKISSKSIH